MKLIHQEQRHTYSGYENPECIMNFIFNNALTVI